ncbi:tryptophan 7-halogenase [Sphingomonas psychrotolerans]|uniref:Tryptophan 7-halogenase n=1 Tax=Sphingomonas psychrotolerans TaxID=1327635 RepID=A0ABU3N1K7_9SPHN|nr:tryptophan halogenase family protein [Sphingomonas psychrotolerans]MDT8758443.1 tryptophan 7-halogenase [Sphingomonas psychrotolerans]
MPGKQAILVVGGGTAGWLSAAYLARFFGGRVAVTLLESPEIGIIGVGEGAFPTIRSTLQFLGIDEGRFIREASATFKQGIRFDDWRHAPRSEGARHRYLHPFEAPFHPDGESLIPYWLLQDEATRAPFAEALTMQAEIALARHGPKRAGEGEYSGPLNYAYHFDARQFARTLQERAVELGVRHLTGLLTGVELAQDGSISRVHTAEHGALEADLYVDCSGFRAELIGKALNEPFTSLKHQLFTDRALACKIPYSDPEAPIESLTIATAHEAGWIWDIGLQSARGIGCVYSSAHMSDAAAAETLRAYVGHDDYSARVIPFEPGYRERQWVKNCVAIGLSAGFLEPLESTGVVLIEAAVAMIAEFFPYDGPADLSAVRFNRLMTARFERIVNFLKLHYCLSEREEPFWRDNTNEASIPEGLRALIGQWRHRAPSRFDFDLDVESFAFFNYQYILYGMGFRTDLFAARENFPHSAAAEKFFARIRSFGESAVAELPTHRALIREINAAAAGD